MIVWGGQTFGVAKTNTGGLYDPLTDRWSPTRDDATAPAARDQHIALWTGVEMIVWGGSLNTAPTFANDGGRYRPGTDTWTAIPSVPASPEPRTGHASAWNGAELIVWGGASASTGGPISTGGRYDVLHDTWRPTRNDATAPPQMSGAKAVWTGSQMIVWGGTTRANLSWMGDAGGRYCAAVPDFTDGDGDGVPDASDCAPLDPTASDVPQVEVQGLMLSGAASATLTRDAPAGAPANTTYDLLYGDLALLHLDGSMIRMSCLASALPLAPYPDSSGSSLDDGNYYLVRSRNACGAGPVGSSSSGDPRPAPACP
jgi:hypothetical protein